PEPGMGLVIAVVGWALITYFSEPWGRLWGTGQDARCYYQATLADPYLHSAWNDPIAYVYSPAFLQLVTPLIQLPWQAFIAVLTAPLLRLPWQAFMAVWTALLIAAARFLTGPWLLAADPLFPGTVLLFAVGDC